MNKTYLEGLLGMDNFIILGTLGANTAVGNAVFGNILNGDVENACYLSAPRNKTRIGHYIQRLTVKEYVPFFLRKIIREKIVELRFDDIRPYLVRGANNYVIAVPSTRPFERITPEFVRELRKEPMVTSFIYYFVDGFARTAEISKCSEELLMQFLTQFDHVFTYDHIDSEKYGFRWVDAPIWTSRTDGRDKNEHRDVDIYFSGREKDRGKLINDVYHCLREKGCNVKFDVIPEKILPSVIEKQFVAEWKDYTEIVKDAVRANCLLEIVAPINHGETLRYKEAIIYNKKLLTNNPYCKDLPYYDPRWIRYFEKPEDIDPAWVSKVENIDYHYTGTYSNESFLNHIAELILEKD